MGYISIGRFKQWGFASPFNGGGKGDSPPPPDYTPMAAASEESARLGAELGREQLAENRRQYDMNMAVAQPVIAAQIQQMKDTGEQAKEYYDYSQKTFRPIEESLAADATEFSTDAAKEQFARSATADLEQAQTNSLAQNNRNLAAMGINPNSAKFAAVNRQQSTMDAAARAGATTSARERADSLGWAKRMDVTGLGRGLAGAANASYGMATNSGNSAVGAQNGTSGQFMNGMAQGTGTIMQGQGQRLQGLGSILNSQTSGYNSALSASASESASNGQMIGAGVGTVAVMV
jgi:hypothetical protein